MPKILEILEKNRAEVQSEVLADEVVLGETDGYVKDWNINGENCDHGSKTSVI